jgi:hypothetical protein
MIETTAYFVALRDTTYHRAGRAVELKAGARLVLPAADPTVDRTELAQLVRAGALKPAGAWRRAGRMPFARLP